MMGLSSILTSTFCHLLGLLAILSSTTAAPHLAGRSIASSSYVIRTSLGPAKGVGCGSGAARFTLPYAQPPVGNLRFANPQAPAPFKNGTTYDATATPPSCYGSNGARGGNAPSEDCLYATVYTPATASSTSKLGVLVWIPGGSFIGGSATGAGLDASNLAVKQNMVVVVLQHRLGLFGFFQNAATLDETNGGAPNATKVAGNQAVRDVVAALTFVKNNAAAFGGNPSAITIAGQSSGAHMVRVLLTTPAASSLFARAALYSDPQNYGLSNASQAAELTNYGLEDLDCTTLACARSKSADDIIGATYDAFSSLPPVDPTMPTGEPFRPSLGKYIPRSLERGLVLKTVTLNKAVLFSTVKNEAGTQAGTIFEPTAAGATTLTIRANGFPVDFTTAASLIFNAGRGVKAAQSPVYAFNAMGSAADSLRAQVELLGTDGLWRCAVQTNAINAQKSGAKVYLAQTNVGSTYPSNADVDYCQKSGIVCHEDDIFLIFGTIPSSASTAVKAVSAEWQARLGAFVKTGSPNTNNFGGWNAVGGASALNLLVFGADTNTGKSQIQQQQRKGVCGPSGIWGSTVQFDWQLYHA
ncbi:hypothetical protein A4X13_0g2039 [Tilletia indica]|uniref:Carboxylic ester hydrolase n=1 Tax=Tilletia indica TaxID=43049 RepID=A0A8T8T9G6_9BASI|nr:hypothetical protein A4X13_0g2039 [Tilletia indica]